MGTLPTHMETYTYGDPSVPALTPYPYGNLPDLFRLVHFGKRAVGLRLKSLLVTAEYLQKVSVSPTDRSCKRLLGIVPFVLLPSVFIFS